VLHGGMFARITNGAGIAESHELFALHDRRGSGFAQALPCGNNPDERQGLPHAHRRRAFHDKACRTRKLTIPERPARGYQPPLATWCNRQGFACLRDGHFLRDSCRKANAKNNFRTFKQFVWGCRYRLCHPTRNTRLPKRERVGRVRSTGSVLSSHGLARPAWRNSPSEVRTPTHHPARANWPNLPKAGVELPRRLDAPTHKAGKPLPRFGRQRQCLPKQPQGDGDRSHFHLKRRCCTYEVEHGHWSASG
jgi:hypothetical protein